MDKPEFAFYASSFVTVLIVLSGLGMPLISSNVTPDEINPNTDVCSNIGGFDAVGDILGCVSDRLTVLDYLFLSSENSKIAQIFIPITLTTGLIILLIIRGN